MAWIIIYLLTDDVHLKTAIFLYPRDHFVWNLPPITPIKHLLLIYPPLGNGARDYLCSMFALKPIKKETTDPAFYSTHFQSVNILPPEGVILMEEREGRKGEEVDAEMKRKRKRGIGGKVMKEGKDGKGR